MIRHVVMFTWKPEATEEQREAVAAGLAELPGAIPQIRRYEYGPGMNPGNKDFVLVADFDGPEDFVAYRDHPAHRAFIERCVEPIAADLARAQYRLPG